MGPVISRGRVITACMLATAGLIVLPLTSVLAYSQTVRDDGGCCTAFYGSWSKNNGQGNSVWNGWDYDAEVTTSSSASAQYFPYPSPSPYYMCPHVHIPNISGWDQGCMEYYHQYDGAATVVNQWFNVGNWVNVTPQSGSKYNYNDALTIWPEYSGYTVSADGVAFHYNPNNPNDSSCS